MDPIRPCVVIVGGGFGGLAAARALRRAPVDVTVIDRENYHLFQPLLYQVATAELHESDVAAPLRTVLAGQRNARVVLGEVSEVDLERRVVKTQLGEVPYDFLVLASGAEPNYHGHGDWEVTAPCPKTLDAALEIRRRVLTAVEQAEGVSDPAMQERLLEFVVVGGGPTGVEFAGALGEAARAGLANNLRRIDPRRARVHLVQGPPRVLPSYPEALSKKAASELQQLGVVLHIGKHVKSIDPEGVTLDGGERIEAANVIWAAGVRPTSLATAIPADHAHGRVVVEPDLSLAGHPEVFAIGDMTHVEQDGAPLPAVSPVAIQQGEAVARSIVRTLHAQEREPFRYFDKGSLATIGHFRAVAKVGRAELSGVVAWMIWGLVHIYYLAGIRNRLSVMFTWIWSTITRKRANPIITGLHHPLASPQEVVRERRAEMERVPA
jgi:NADH:ubiquinone reductase (H+-translocating)